MNAVKFIQLAIRAAKFNMTQYNISGFFGGYELILFEGLAGYKHNMLIKSNFFNLKM